MAGVEILNSFEVPIEYTFNWVAALVFFIVMVIIITIVAIITGVDWRVGLITGFLTGIIFGIIVGCASQNPSKYETHYEVLLSDEITLTEFLEDYEIVGQEGKIYTIRERTEADG